MKARIHAWLAATALASGAWTSPLNPEPFELQGSRLVVEHNVSNGDAALILETDSHEPLERVELLSPAGATLLRVQLRVGALRGLGGLKLETSDGGLAELLARCPPGSYPLRAKSSTGRWGFGAATLSSELPAPPSIVWPTAGANVSAVGLSVSWSADPSAVEQRIGLEQGDSDLMVARLAAGVNTLDIPSGVLVAGRRAKLEVISVAANGNRSASELEFLVH